MRGGAFEAFAARKTREAERASIHRLTTIEDRSSRYSLETIGNEWTRQLYDGPFHLVRLKPDTTSARDPVTHDPGTHSFHLVRLKPDTTSAHDPGTHDPGTHDPGTHDPGTHDPGTHDPVGSGFSRTRTQSRTPDPGSGIPAPSISLVFLQSRDGNTGTDNPEELGGGATDKHLIYEGLSRVAADAVLAGATTAAGEHVFFSVWHPQLLALRTALGLPRHPAQVVITGRACINPDTALVFNVPDVPAIVIGSVYACDVLAKAAATRSWMQMIPMEGDDLRPALCRLRREFGIQRISCIGGRTTATALLDAGLVQDICLTTSPREAGEPGTPFYVGKKPPKLEPIVRKRGMDPDAPILFEHLAVRLG